MIKWHLGHITAAIAEAEPERERLFTRPPRRQALNAIEAPATPPAGKEPNQ